MNIARIEFDPHTSSLNVFVAGCAARSCEGCHNTELWDFSAGVWWRTEAPRLATKLRGLGSAIDKVFLFGGEPLDQNIDELTKLCYTIRNNTKAALWLFTGKDIEDVPESVLGFVDFVKTGKHVPNSSQHTVNGVKLSSLNQKVYKVHHTPGGLVLSDLS